MERRLYLSSSDKKIAGVCGGFAKYLDIDPTLVRIAYAVLVLFGGTGVLLYIICALVMPEEGKF
jgi:phage shock protein C